MPLTVHSDAGLERLKSIARGAIRRLVTAPLNAVGARLRAEALELLCNRMIAEAPVRGGRLKFYAPSPLLQARAAGALSKEPDTVRWLDALGGDDVFWDVGANVGLFSLYAAMRANCAVLAFEPSAANFYVLARNIQLNGFDDRVTAYCVALSGATGRGVLNLSSAAMGAALHQFGKAGDTSPYWDGESSGLAHGMLAMTVDDFIARFDPPFPTHFKIDVDGLELQILLGAANTLRDARVRAVMVELSLTGRDEREQAVAFLSGLGLTLASRGEVQEAPTGSAANHLFVRL